MIKEEKQIIVYKVKTSFIEIMETDIFSIFSLLIKWYLQYQQDRGRNQARKHVNNLVKGGNQCYYSEEELKQEYDLVINYYNKHYSLHEFVTCIWENKGYFVASAFVILVVINAFYEGFLR